METFEIISQWVIMIFGAAAIWLVGRTENYGKWGFLIGLFTQPFWIFTTWYHEQYGIFLLSIWYTYSWWQGVWNFIIKGGSRGEKIQTIEDEGS